jgi:geranylgeranyl pyrophosphate synthase
VGDYLIGLGYRLVSSSRGELGAEVAADILDRMATAHLRLCDGQGAEMAWQDAPQQTLSPLDALQIYALKTSPAFEAALYAGLRMAGPTEQYDELVSTFSRNLGVGFQILNDLKDWQGDDHNKLVAGQDAEAIRPTLLLALAQQGANPQQRSELDELCHADFGPGIRSGQLRRLFETTGAFEKAHALVDKSRARAEALADNVEPQELRQLLYFLIDTVLSADEVEPAPSPMLLSLPIAGVSS